MDPNKPSPEEFQELFSNLQAEIGKVIVGQDEVLRKVLLGFLSGGHILLEGVPGLAKTLLIQTLSKAVQADFSRIQFTPDMLPGDVTGTQIFNPKEGSYSVRRGPALVKVHRQGEKSLEHHHDLVELNVLRFVGR